VYLRTEEEGTRDQGRVTSEGLFLLLVCLPYTLPPRPYTLGFYGRSR
jgi:hypothetical protein